MTPRPHGKPQEQGPLSPMNELIIMPAEGSAKTLLDRARAAWGQIKTDETWHAWLTVGEGLVWCRTEAMRRAHTDDIRANRYRTASQAVLREERLDEIDKGVRSHLLDVMDNLGEITT